MIVRIRPSTETATPMMEITLRLNGVMTVIGPGSVGLGRTSCGNKATEVKVDA